MYEGQTTVEHYEETSTKCKIEVDTLVQCNKERRVKKPI